MFRTLDINADQTPTCKSIRPNYTDSSIFNTIKQQTFVDNLEAIGGITGNMYIANKNSTNASSNVKAKDDLAKLIALESILDEYLSCISSDLQEMTRQASKIYSLQDQLKINRKKVSEMKEIAKTAEERSQLVSDPYSQTSYHESWFPLGRPIKKENIPVLVAFSIFFLVFAFAMFLRLSALDLQFVPYVIGQTAFTKNFISTKPQ